MEHVEESAAELAVDRIQPAGRATLAAALCAAGVGLLLVYVSGFAQTGAVHNAAHDSRHSAGFPCH